MRNKRVVIALGGNALEERNQEATAENQKKTAEKTAEQLAGISKAGYEMVIVHGNGPQVGRIVLASEAAAALTPVMPLDVCGAMSQGYIGYQLQQAMRTALYKEGLGRIPVISLISQVRVDPEDPAFENPTKPVGVFYSKEEAERIQREKGYIMREDAGRGWRRVVASPVPREIIEFPILEKLWDSSIVIMCGGGGVPVVETTDRRLEGAAAVIDKDLAAALLAEEIEADILMILTDVKNVILNYRKENETPIEKMSVDEAEKYMEEGQFPAGSMLPKIKAAAGFAASGQGRISVIGSLNYALENLSGKAGTRIGRV